MSPNDLSLAPSEGGYDEQQIAARLAQRNNYDLLGALESGRSLREIIDEIHIKEMTQDKFLELLLCPPKYLSARIPNNQWMKQKDGEDKVVNVDKAMAQFFQMFALFSQDALVYLLPPNQKYQDQLYITNAGAVLPHLYKTIVLSKYKAEGRPGEEEELRKFLDLTGYRQFYSPFYFEGEAELKWLRENIYIGGYGIRTDIQAHNWMEEKFGCQIIKIKESDPKRYHLDCNVFPLSGSKLVVAKDCLTPPIQKELESVAELIPVSKRESQFSITNSLRIGSIIYSATSISEMKKGDEEYQPEKEKNEKLEEICRDAGLELVFLNISEVDKSGAALS